jgi:hypothetical protein
MSNKFDELAKGMAQPVTRRGALKKFGVGMAGIVLAALGLVNKANANPGWPPGHPCNKGSQCASGICAYFGFTSKKTCG